MAIQPPAASQPATSPRGLPQLLKRERAAFDAPQVADFVGKATPQAPKISKELSQFIESTGRDFVVGDAGVYFGERSELERLELLTRDALLHDESRLKFGDPDRLAGCIVQGAVLAGTSSRLTAEAVALLAFVERSSDSDKFLINLLQKQWQGGVEAAGNALLQVAFYAADDSLAVMAAQALAPQQDGILKQLLGTREGLSQLRQGMILQSRAPLVAALLESNAHLKKFRERDLPDLNVELARLQSELLALKAEEAYRKEVERCDGAEQNFLRRANRPICTIETGAWGEAEGKREVDRIPVGARITGARIYYRENGPILGVQFVYDDSKGEKGETPLRGTNDGKSHTFEFSANEYITSFTVEGDGRGGIAYMRLRTARLHGKKEDIKDYKLNSRHVAYPWDKACDSGKDDGCELALINEPVAIGLVSFCDGDLKAFGLVLQYNNDPDPRPVKDEFVRRWIAERTPRPPPRDPQPPRGLWPPNK